MATHMVAKQEGKKDVVYGTPPGRKQKGYYIKLKSGGYEGPYASLDEAKARIAQIKGAQAYHH